MGCFWPAIASATKEAAEDLPLLGCKKGSLLRSDSKKGCVAPAYWH